MTPDIERVVSDYLRSHPDIEALGARVRGTPPEDTSTPWVQVVQLDGRQAADDRTDHLVEGYLQLDCYSTKDGGQPEAVALGRAVRDALTVIEQASHSGAVVTAGRINGQARIPDTDGFEPARERVIVTASVWAHE